MGLFNKKKDNKTDGKAEKEAEVKDANKKATAPKADASKPAKKAAKKDSMKDLYVGGKVEKKPVAAKKGDKPVKSEGIAYKVLVKPLITEKAADLGSQDKYVFEVGVSSNKIEVAKAVNEVYGVKPVSVNIVNMKGKTKRQGRHMGKRRDWKKAIITLPKGKTINIYEGV